MSKYTHKCKKCGEIWESFKEHPIRCNSKLRCRTWKKEKRSSRFTIIKQGIEKINHKINSSSTKSYKPKRVKFTKREVKRENLLLVKIYGYTYHHPVNPRDCYLKRYNISSDQFDKILKSQDNKCAICRRFETVRCNNKIKTLSVDHNHITNKVRGLLCQRCNTALGLFNDDILVLQNAIDYLKQHEYFK